LSLGSDSEDERKWYHTTF